MLTPAQLDEIRARNPLSTIIARDVKLAKAGREYKACCPFHGEKTPSFYVNDQKGFYHCFGCSAHGDAIRWMRDFKGLSFLDAVAALNGGEIAKSDHRAEQRSSQKPEAETVDSIEVARRAWAVRRPIAETLVETYLRSRKLPVDRLAGYLDNIWFAPDCPTKAWEKGRDHSSVPTAPAMICPIAKWDGEAESQIGCHVTYLDQSGAKTGRKMFGEVQGGAVLLTSMRGKWPLLNGEGIETTLAGLALLLMRGQPVFRVAATLSLNNHQGYPVKDADGALPLWNIRYDRQRPAFGFPNPGAVWSLADADMSYHQIKVRRSKGGPVETGFAEHERTLVCKELLRQKWKHFGATSHTGFEPPHGMDYNDAYIAETTPL